MTVTLPDVDPVGADVLGARPAADPLTGTEAVEIALHPDGEDPRLFTLSVCAAYHLREVLDAALEAPFWWEEDLDEDPVGPFAPLAGGVGAPENRPPGHRSVRWDETWTEPARR